MAFLNSEITSGQATFFVAFAWSIVAWLLAEYFNVRRHPHDEGCRDEEDQQLLAMTGPGNSNGASEVSKGPAEEPPKGNGTHCCDGYGPHSGMLESVAHSGLIACLKLQRPALLQHRLVLRSVVEFGCLMAWYFLSDRTLAFPEGPKSYSRDLFLFIFVILTCVAGGCSIRAFKMPLLLNRAQTEEWKGWMQILFLMYHYFEAKEAYNAIRIFIAAYVWMTGFGNFSYYYRTGDFCIGRFAQMLWRLNFLVFFSCVVLNNSYMLYYICPMHTIFTVFVYVALAVAPQLNQNNFWCLFKIGLCFLFIFVTWDIQRVFYFIWSPFTWLLGYSDPRQPTNDLLHEWYFRSSLDRYIWIYGMLCAFMHPPTAAALKYIDELPVIKRYTVRTVVLAVCGGISYVYYEKVYTLPKYEYNAVHPYTSWIPITLWIIVRNMTPSLRTFSMRMYGWLGCITLETYISQFHIWMKSVVPDGQPKALLVLIPGYPLLNFALVSALYIFVSHRLFEVTNALKNAAVPHPNNTLLLRNVIMLAVAGLMLWLAVTTVYTSVRVSREGR